MTDSLSLSFVIAVTCLNTMMIVKLWRSRKANSHTSSATRVGDQVPTFDYYQNSKRRCSSHHVWRPTVMVFLSSGCPKCAVAARQLEMIFLAMEARVVDLWIIGLNSYSDLTKLFRHDEITSRIVEISHQGFLKMNPTRATPLYIFVNASGIVEKRSIVGDEDWNVFVDELLTPT